MSNNELTHITISRRELLKMIGATSLLPLLAACQGAIEDDPGASTTDEAILTWWNEYSSETTQEMVPLIVADFEELYPNIKVEFELTGGPPGGGDYTEILLSRIAAGNPPSVATLFAPPVQFAAREALIPIDDMMQNAQWAKPGAFFEGVLKSCQWQGKTYGLPASAGATSIIINKELFAAKGISTARADFPTDWQGLKDLAAELTVYENGELTQVGFVPWAATWLAPAWMGSNGGSLFDSDSGEYTVNSDQNIELLTYWLSWLDDIYQGDLESLNIFGSFGDAYDPGSFALGKAAMEQDGSWAMTDVGISFDMELQKYPIGPSGSRSQTAYWPNWFVIPNGAENPEASFLLVEYFATKGWETWYKFILDTPSWKEFPTDIITERLVEVHGDEKAQDINDFYANYLEDAVEMWNSPVNDFATDAFASAVDETLNKVKTPKEALDDAQNSVQAQFEEVMGQ